MRSSCRLARAVTMGRRGHRPRMVRWSEARRLSTVIAICVLDWERSTIRVYHDPRPDLPEAASRGRDAAGLDEGVERRRLQSDVLPELDVVDVSLGDRSPHEPATIATRSRTNCIEQ